MRTRVRPSTPALRRQVGHALEGRDVFRAAIRIAGVVDRVDADEDVAGLQRLGPGQREGQEHGVARRHVGDGMPCADLGRIAPCLGTAMSAVSAEPPNSRRSMRTMRCSAAPSAPATRARGLQFHAVPLAVVERQARSTRSRRGAPGPGRWPNPGRRSAGTRRWGFIFGSFRVSRNPAPERATSAKSAGASRRCRRPARQRDEDHARHAPGKAHHQRRDGAGLRGRQFLRHHHVHRNGEQQDQPAQQQAHRRERRRG